jgi:hypothetical protein
MKNRVKIHKEICDILNDTYKSKNSDYGGSFEKVRAEYPDAIIVRLMDKLERIKTLKKKQGTPEVKDESLVDSFLDLANYCIMEIIEMEMDSEKEEDGQIIVRPDVNNMPKKIDLAEVDKFLFNEMKEKELIRFGEKKERELDKTYSTSCDKKDQHVLSLVKVDVGVVDGIVREDGYYSFFIDKDYAEEWVHDMFDVSLEEFLEDYDLDETEDLYKEGLNDKVITNVQFVEWKVNENE